MSFSIPITVDSSVNVAIIKANRFLLQEYNELLSSAKDKDAELRRLWATVFNANLVLDDRVDFKSDIDKTMFLLRWG